MSSLSRLKPIVPIVILAVIGVAYWMLLLSPKRDEITALDGRIAAANTQLQQTEATAALYEKARVDYKANYTKLVRLGKAVPNDDDVRTLLVELQDAAGASGVTFRSLNVGGGASAPAAPGTGSTAASSQVIPGATPVTGTDLSALDFDLNFDGTFFNTSQLLTRLERFVSTQNKQMSVTGRLLRLESIDIQPGGDSWQKLTAKVKARAYLMPPIQPVGTTPVPAGSGSATPAGGTTPTTTPTTTASITTGVNR
jgi:hypothetical protein